MAEVWLGIHRASGVELAVKVMTAENLQNDVFEQAFEAEARAVASLDHPGIIRLYDVGTVLEETARASLDRLAAGSPYLVMELAPGGNLRTDPPPYDWETVRRGLLEVLAALAHAHSRDVIHRDIKPGNVMWGRPLRPDGPPRLVLSDFGIAHAGEGGSRGGPTWGTPAYMAPERFTLEWRDLGPWTDLYAVGCLAYTLLRGRPPFKGEPLAQAMQAHLYRPIPSLRARCPVPGGLDAWLRGMLAKVPGERFQTAADAAWALRELGEAPRGDMLAVPEPVSADTEPTHAAGRRIPTRSRGPATRDRPLSVTAQDDALSTVNSISRLAHASTLADITWTDDTFDPALLSRDSVRIHRPPVHAPRGGHSSPPMPDTWRDPDLVELPADIPGGGLRLFGLRVVRLADREAERDALWHALAEVRQRGRPRGVLLRGRLGMGKTRLAEWLCERAAEVGAALPLRADHGPGGSSPALARMVAQHLRVTGLGPRTLRSRVLAWLQSRGVQDELLAKELVAVASHGAGHGQSEAEQPRDLRATLRRFLELLARERPVILFLDDVAWGPTSLSFAVELLEQERRLPVLVLLTAREEAMAAVSTAEASLHALVEEGSLREVDVRPLPVEHRLELVRNLLGVEPRLAEQVARQTAGNPLFTVTLVRDWVARGALTESLAGLVAAPGADPAFPQDLAEVWARRLADTLGEPNSPHRRALEIAAALGEAVEDEEWRAACQLADSPLPADLLPRLLAERLAARSAGGWRFVHDIVRESVAVSAQQADRWVPAHSACVAMLLSTPHVATPHLRERLGRHLAAAGRPEEGLPALLEGAEHRLRQGDAAAARLVLDEVLAVLELVPHARAAAARARACILQSRILLTQGRARMAAPLARQAEAAALSCEDASEGDLLHARSRLLLAESALTQGLATDASRHLGVAEGLLRRQPLVEPEDHAWRLRLLGGLSQGRGEVDAAEEALSEAAGIYGTLGRPEDWAACVTALAEVATDRGETEQASELLATALATLHKLRHRPGEADALRIGGLISLSQSDLAQADQRFRRAQAIYLRLGSHATRACRLGRARVAVARDQLDEAARLLAAVRAEQPSSLRTRARTEAVALLLAAHQADWTAFDRALEALSSLLLRSGLGSAELRTLAQEAAHAATTRGQADRAARARTLIGG